MSEIASQAPHRGVTAILGPPLPSNPLRSVFLALKAGAACALALLFDALTGNPDHVSSTFVAVLSVSPVVLMGLRRSLDQVVGSVVGGLWGAGCMLLGLTPGLGIPLAVAAAVYSAFLFGFGRGFAVAAFSAMFVQAVPFGARWRHSESAPSRWERPRSARFWSTWRFPPPPTRVFFGDGCALPRPPSRRSWWKRRKKAHR